MPFRSQEQMRGAFGGFLGQKMKDKALQWAHETPNIKNLPFRVGKPENDRAKKIGMSSPYKEVSRG